MPSAAESTEQSIGIAGSGRVARALGRLLYEAGEPVICVASRDPVHAREAAAFIGSGVAAVGYEDLPAAGRWLIAVPDRAIEAVAAVLPAAGGIALHTCGARGPEALHLLATRGVSCGMLHPLQTFAAGAGAEAARGIFFAVAGNAAALKWAQRMVALAGGSAISIRPDRIALYHAAAVMASNYVTSLLDAARQLMVDAGAPAESALPALAPLVRTGVENTLRLGPRDALTGPIERGDTGTVARHVSALAAAAPTIRSLYGCAGLHTLAIARARGLGADTAAALEDLLKGN